MLDNFDNLKWTLCFSIFIPNCAFVFHLRNWTTRLGLDWYPSNHYASISCTTAFSVCLTFWTYNFLKLSIIYRKNTFTCLLPLLIVIKLFAHWNTVIALLWYIYMFNSWFQGVIQAKLKHAEFGIFWKSLDFLGALFCMDCSYVAFGYSFMQWLIKFHPISAFKPQAI